MADITFNLTHDNEVIAMAVAPGSMLPPAYSIGVDVMKLHVPRKESLRSFVEGVGDALTTLEYSLVCGNNVSDEEGLRRFFWIWTMKEAYTKALGLGLGFDFKRVEHDVAQDVLMVDGREPQGWEFFKFTISKDTDTYVGVAARFLGGDDPCKIAQLDSESLVVSQGTEFTQAMIDRIGKGNR
ncbi:hypothetical protein ONZ45_g19350 [Pleurotus djamor]|nr:hypothetical protein ONZ45_g19350 [Pleurotus djamor]